MTRLANCAVWTLLVVGLTTACDGTAGPTGTNASPSGAGTGVTHDPPSPIVRITTDPDTALIGTRWLVHRVTQPGGQILPSGEVAGTAFVIFDTKGGFVGSTGCASIAGTAIVVGDRIDIAMSGKPTCAAGGAVATFHGAIVSALHGSVNYDVDWLTLTLTASDGTQLELRAG